MKNKLMLVLSLATVAAVSAPLSAQASHGKNRNSSGVYDRNGDGVIDSRDQVGTNCVWYDVNCRISNSRNGGTTSDGSWQVVGRDRNGNTIYQRQRTDGNGNVIVDTARQDSNGRLIITNSQVMNQNSRRNNTVYGQNGENCKYKQNKNGYSTNCKYDKVKANKGKQDNDGDENGRYNNGGTYNNNTSGPWYDVGANGNGNGKQKHGKHD